MLYSLFVLAVAGLELAHHDLQGSPTLSYVAGSLTVIFTPAELLQLRESHRDCHLAWYDLHFLSPKRPPAKVDSDDCVIDTLCDFGAWVAPASGASLAQIIDNKYIYQIKAVPSAHEGAHRCFSPRLIGCGSLELTFNLACAKRRPAGMLSAAGLRPVPSASVEVSSNLQTSAFEILHKHPDCDLFSHLRSPSWAAKTIYGFPTDAFVDALKLTHPSDPCLISGTPVSRPIETNKEASTLYLYDSHASVHRQLKLKTSSSPPSQCDKFSVSESVHGALIDTCQTATATFSLETDHGGDKIVLWTSDITEKKGSFVPFPSELTAQSPYNVLRIDLRRPLPAQSKTARFNLDLSMITTASEHSSTDTMSVFEHVGFQDTDHRPGFIAGAIKLQLAPIERDLHLIVIQPSSKKMYRGEYSIHNLRRNTEATTLEIPIAKDTSKLSTVQLFAVEKNATLIASIDTHQLLEGVVSTLR